MPVLNDWINPLYLEDNTIHDLQESIKAKPVVGYAILDNFFKLDKLEALIEAHKTLEFSFEADGSDRLPYDSAVVFAQEENYGSELFFNEEWQRYCCDLLGVNLDFPIGTEIKLRWHRPYSSGFWLHTDGISRDLVVIAYFNKNWKASDGGLLQLWVDKGEVTTSDTFPLEDLDPQDPDPQDRLNMLNKLEWQCPKRLFTKNPGGGIESEDGNSLHEFILIDQIVPVYNRVVLCNFQTNPAFHSITPSNGKERTGFLQWMFSQKNHDRVWEERRKNFSGP